MEVIKTGDNRVANIINKKSINGDVKYRLSLFTYMYSGNNGSSMKNTLTNEVVKLTEEEYSAITKITEPVPYEYIEQNHLTELVQKRYIVEEDYDEIEKYKQVIFLLKTIAGNKKGLNTYIIFPTTGCNARCVYCYEEGYKIKTMTPEIADRLVDFICESKRDDTVKLLWFGGEPLVGVNIIRRICNGLKERNVDYTSTMITNASLMTKELAHEAKELWHLNKVQVSLDGAKEDYNIRKNYFDHEKYNYDVVIRAIHYLADEGMKVKLRVNTDFGNLDHMAEFFEDIKAEFGNKDNIKFYLAPVFQTQHSDRCIELHEKMIALGRQISSLDMDHMLIDKNKKRFKVNRCMADNMNDSIVITPEGLFGNCEHQPELGSWGNIFDGITDQDLYEEKKRPVQIDEKCRKCPFLPQCTPYFKTKCPNCFEMCYECNCLRTDEYLRILLEGVNVETEDDEEEL